MLLRRIVERLRRGQVLAEAIKATPMIEAMESRLLLTVSVTDGETIIVQTSAGSTYNILIDTDTSTTPNVIRIWNGGSLVTSKLDSGFTHPKDISVTGANLNDIITVDSSFKGSAFIDGFGGNDSLVMSNTGRSGVPNILTGGAGNDTLTGGPGVDALNGGDDDDILSDGGGNDTSQGGNGNDTLVAGTGQDVLEGDANTDTVDYSARSANVTINLHGGASSGESGENDNIGLGADDIEAAIGGSGNDTINAGPLTVATSLVGGLGNDTITGGSGADTLVGQAGTDVLDGGMGNDTIGGGNGEDTVTYATRSHGITISLDNLANDGQSGEQDNVSTDVEDVTTGSGDDSITGSSVANILIGNAGNDTLTGGAGADQLYGNDDADVFHSKGDGSVDTVRGGPGGDDVSDTDATDDVLA